MPYELIANYLKLPVFVMVASRLGAMIMIQPVFSALSVPMKLRALLVVGLAALVTPFVEIHHRLPDTPGGLALAMGAEILLGSLVGLAVRVCFLGLQMGGQLVAQESGLAFGQVADPSTGDQQSVLSAFYLQLGAVVYLILGGHRILVAACLDSFRTIPLLGEGGVFLVGGELLVEALTAGVEMAVRVAAPTILTLFLVNIAMGFVARTVPQINIATVGFSLKGLVAFFVISISLPSAAAAFTDVLERVTGWLTDLTGV
jgi:flagellar biosynthetic protein FliR